MAFSASGINLVIGTLGGGPLRVFAYETEDTEETVTAAGYITSAEKHGLQRGDTVIIRRVSGETFVESFETTIEDIDANGAATLTITENTEIYTRVPDALEELAAPVKIRSKWDRWSIQDFGYNPYTATFASTNSVDAFRKALQSHEKIFIPKGNYPWRYDGDTYLIDIQEDGPIDVECANGAKFILGNEARGIVTNFARFLPSTVTEDNVFSWKGGTFDFTICEKVNVGDAGEVPTAVDLHSAISHHGYRQSLFEDIIFNGGTTTPTDSLCGYGYGTNFIHIRGLNTRINRCKFIGSADLGVYISGDVLGDDINLVHEGFNITNCYFYRCTSAVSGKRDSLIHYIAGNTAYECVNGFRAADTDDGPDDFGRRWVITGNQMYHMFGRPVSLSLGRGDIVSNNIIQDWGCRPTGDDNAKDAFGVSVNNQSAAVAIFDGEDTIVSGNLIKFKDWTCVSAGGYAAGTSSFHARAPIAIRVYGDSVGVETDGNKFANLPSWGLRVQDTATGGKHRNESRNSPQGDSIASTSVRYIQAPQTFRAAIAGIAAGAAAQTISSATATKVALATVIHDTYGGFDEATNYRWTPVFPSSVAYGCGLTYKVKMSAVALVLTGLVDGESIIIEIRKNGSATTGATTQYDRATATTNQTFKVEATDVCSPGDYYEFWVRINGAGDKTIASDARYTWFDGMVIE